MNKISKIINSSYNDIVLNLDKYIDIFLSQGVIGFSKSSISINDQLNIMNLFSERLNWGHIPSMNVEDHEYSIKNFSNKIDEIFIPWHLEHVMSSNPQIAASWKMIKLNSQKGSGLTGFVHSNDIYKLLPEEWKDFLKKSFVINSNKDFKERPAIFIHKNTGKEIIRIEPNGTEELHSFCGEIPSSENINLFNKINHFIQDNVEDNADLQKWWDWEEDDLVLVDLFSMNHCVTGGFNLGERIFTRLWAFEDDPSKHQYIEFFLNESRK